MDIEPHIGLRCSASMGNELMNDDSGEKVELGGCFIDQDVAEFRIHDRSLSLSWGELRIMTVRSEDDGSWLIN